MSKSSTELASLGDLAFESKVRAADVPETELRVYGVDRIDGLTAEAKYTSKDLSRYKVLRPGMFAYNPMRLNIGSIAACTDKHIAGLVSPDYVVFGCKPDRLDAGFMQYAIRGPEWRQWTTAAGVGSVRVRIYFRELASMPINIPPLAQQKAVAEILRALDDKIELISRMNSTLCAIARALFQSWFVDFDPVRAKLDGRTPFGIDSRTAALFPAAFHDSEVGPIPQGWSLQSVGEVVDCVGGGTPSTVDPKYWEGGTYHWATPKDLSSLQAPVLLNTARRLTRAGIAKISSGLLPAGTLLLSSRAPVGYLAIAAMPVAINQGFIALKCNERASNLFMLNWCQSNIAEIESRATGTTFAEISKQNFRTIRVLLPPEELMSIYTEKVAPLYAQVEANLRQSHSLAIIRDTLLPKLVSGEWGVNFPSDGATIKRQQDDN